MVLIDNRLGTASTQRKTTPAGAIADENKRRERKTEKKSDPRGRTDSTHTMPHPALTAFILCLAIRAACAKFEVTPSPASVAAKPGEDVTVNCILTVDTPQIDMKKLMVQWFHRGKMVAEYDNKIIIDRPDLSLNEETMKNGNISLVIAKAKVEHSGNYRCYVYYQSDFRMREIVLTVRDPTQAKEEEEELLPEPDSSKDPETLRWVKLVKAGVDSLQETVNLMKTDMEKCAAGRHYKAPQH